MIETQPPLRRPPLLVAEGGASVREPPQSAAAVELALRLGATAVWVRAWMTSDAELVISPAASIRRGLKRLPLSSLPAAELNQVSHLSDVADLLGPATALVVEVADVPAGDAVALWAATRSAPTGPDEAKGIWMSGHQVDALARWARVGGVIGTVHGVRVEEITGSLERHFSHLRDLGIDALALPRSSWSGGLVAMAHRFRREAWALGAEHTRMAVDLLTMGVDAVGSAHPDRLVDAAAAMAAAARTAGPGPRPC